MLLTKKYSHSIILLYIPFFLLGFFLLEARTDISEQLIHSRLDDYIPFCEYFVIFYLAWFPYLLGAVLFFFLRGAKSVSEKREFYEFALLLISGLTLSLLIYVFWPSTLNLRPEVYPHDNLFTALCKALQTIDTPSNVCPSMHVYSSAAVHICIRKHSYFRNRKWIQHGSLILVLFICLSTMFIKQHSVIDVIAALLMIPVLYPFVQILLKSKKTETLPGIK